VVNTHSKFIKQRELFKKCTFELSHKVYKLKMNCFIFKCLFFFVLIIFKKRTKQKLKTYQILTVYTNQNLLRFFSRYHLFKLQQKQQ
jgi:hypothetical protein